MLICEGALALGEDPIPAPLPKGRYDALKEHSPFAVATAAPPPAPPSASFAANWFVTGIGRMGDEDFVTIKSRDLSTQFSLFGKGDSVGGVALASVTWSEAVGKSTVILRKGTETAKLEFNEAEIKAAPQARAPGASPMPGAPGAPAPGTAPMPGQPRPGNPQAASANPIPGLANPPPGAGAQVRRRVQVIQPPQ